MSRDIKEVASSEETNIIAMLVDEITVDVIHETFEL